MANGIEPHSPQHDPYQLDRRLTIPETRFDTILPTLATKEDLANLRTELAIEFGKMTKWLVVLTATMFVGFGGMITTLFSVLQR